MSVGARRARGLLGLKAVFTRRFFFLVGVVCRQCDGVLCVW